ncbi:MAG: hypothetical protein ACTSVZ_02065 [Promethearchaeota archaeon]
MIPKTSVENAEFTSNRSSNMKFLFQKLQQVIPKAYHILLVIIGSGFIAFSTFIMLMYETDIVRSVSGYDLIIRLNSNFFINASVASVALLVIEFTLLGGFSKNARNQRIFLIPLLGIVIILFWVFFQFFTEWGIRIFTLINGFLLAYSGFAGKSTFAQKSKNIQPNSFTIIERLFFPVLTSGIFLFIVWITESQGDFLLEGIIIFIMMLLSLVIVTLLNYKQSPRTQFKKLLMQFLGVWLILLLWFFFVTFPFLISYENSSHFLDSAIEANRHALYGITQAAILFGTFYVWDNILYQINRARHSTPHPSQIQTNTAIHPSLHPEDNNKNNQVICPNCNTLLEQDAIRELKTTKKTVFCALCGDQISFTDIYGDEKEAIIREHNQLLEKFTKLPPIKVDRSEE